MVKMELSLCTTSMYMWWEEGSSPGHLDRDYHYHTPPLQTCITEFSACRSNRRQTVLVDRDYHHHHSPPLQICIITWLYVIYKPWPRGGYVIYTPAGGRERTIAILNTFTRRTHQHSLISLSFGIVTRASREPYTLRSYANCACAGGLLWWGLSDCVSVCCPQWHELMARRVLHFSAFILNIVCGHLSCITWLLINNLSWYSKDKLLLHTCIHEYELLLYYILV